MHISHWNKPSRKFHTSLFYVFFFPKTLEDLAKIKTKNMQPPVFVMYFIYLFYICPSVLSFVFSFLYWYLFIIQGQVRQGQCAAPYLFCILFTSRRIDQMHPPTTSCKESLHILPLLIVRQSSRHRPQWPPSIPDICHRQCLWRKFLSCG